MYLLNTSDAFVKLCQSGEFSDFFTLPPDSPTDIAVVEDAFCSTNLTLVLAELDEKFKFSEIASEVSKYVYRTATTYSTDMCMFALLPCIFYCYLTCFQKSCSCE